MRPTPFRLGLVPALSALFLTSPALGDDPAPGAEAPAPEPTAAPKEAAPPEPTGIVPIPDFSGKILHRPYLLGDWGGARTDMAKKGVQLTIDWYQTVQSVVDGGRDTDTRYGGSLDSVLTLDLDRMGAIPGGLVTARFESRYGESVNSISGMLLPVSTDGYFPITNELDENIPFTITDLNYTQYLSPKFAIVFGKIDTLSGDPNEFASGRGNTQFMNSNMVFNSVIALRFPYSTLGGGVIFAPAKWVTISSLIFNTADSSTTTGFEDFGDGVSWVTEADFQYRLWSLPGGQNIGFLYAFDQDFTSLSGSLVFHPGEGLSTETEDDTWAVYWSGWQYVWVKDPSDAPINTLDGRPDHEGIGLFGRFGFADQDTNPVEWSGSGGIGGRGIIPTRENDTFGVGGFYTSLQTNRLTGFLDIDDHSAGLEAYYGLAITPAATLTFDLQIMEPPGPRADTAVILGARLGIRF